MLHADSGDRVHDDVKYQLIDRGRDVTEKKKN